MKALFRAALAALAASAPAYAGWSITGDVERFRWAEETDPRVTETGPMFGIGAGIEQNTHRIGECVDARELQHAIAVLARFPRAFVDLTTVGS